MNTTTYDISIDDLAALAAPHGVVVNRQWVSKYIRLGLIPHERDVPGLGQGQGRRAFYSRVVARQIVPLVQALNAYGKNLGAVGWALWWQGHYSEPRYWRDVLKREAVTWEKVKSEFSASNELGDTSQEKLGELTLQLETRRDLGPLVGAIKRHAPGSISSVMEIFLSVMNGTFAPLDAGSDDPYQIEIARKAFGKSFSIPVTEVDAPELHFPIDVQALSGQLEVMAKLFTRDLKAFLDQKSDTDVCKARDEMSIFMVGISSLERFAQEHRGHSLGAKIIEWGNQSQNSQISWLLGWLVMRENPVLQQNIEGLNEIIKTQSQLIRMGKIWAAPQKSR